MNYRKRDIGHWNQGKGYKGWRKAKEQSFAKREIQEQVDEQDEAFRYKSYSHTKNEKASLEYRVDRYQFTVLRNANLPFAGSLRDVLKKLKKKLKNMESSDG